jgi:cell division protein FtsZ
LNAAAMPPLQWTLLLALPAAHAWLCAAPAPRRAALRLQDEFSVEYAPPPPPAVMPGLGMSPCVIKVIGVGGGGGNTLNRMVEDGPGVERSAFLEYVAANTDVQALSASRADSTVQLGKGSARGLGAGGMPSVGRASAIDATAEIEALVSGTDMVFVTAGMGGGTGSGAAPVVAELAKQAGCLTVGIVTKPFSFEGKRRTTQALEAIDELQRHVDILIVVSNDKVCAPLTRLPSRPISSHPISFHSVPSHPISSRPIP